MATCTNCGKKGLFLFTKNGLCKDCQKLNLLTTVRNNEIKLTQNTHLNNQYALVNSSIDNFNIPSEILSLLWFADGKYKNYTNQKKLNTSLDFLEINFTLISDEPSLIYTNLPISSKVEHPERIENPPYWPQYSSLTPEQKYIYCKFLENPFNGETYIGYVFLFYYGLERHLFEGNFDEAFNVCLQLRKSYRNASFQNYSFCALSILSIARNRLDLFEKLIKEHFESAAPLNINLVILSKIFTNQEFTADELMNYARQFEFTNTKYIKEYPELFRTKLIEAIDSNGKIYPHKILKNCKAQRFPINAFANMSIKAEAEIPNYIEIFKFKEKGYSLLKEAHGKVKIELKNNRDQHEKAEPKQKPIYPEDCDYPNIKYFFECELDETPNIEGIVSYEHPIYRQHIRYQIAIREIYKNRDFPKALLHVKELCKKDINLIMIYGTDRNVGDLDYESFKRLIIIYEKEKNYDDCLLLCKTALELMRKNPHNPFNQYYGNYIKEKIKKYQ